MGCKINKKAPQVEDSIQDYTKNEENNNAGLSPPPIISNENEIKFKPSEFIGEKKGNILDHYVFDKELGAGFSFFCFNLKKYSIAFIKYFRCLWSGEKSEA